MLSDKIVDFSCFSSGTPGGRFVPEFMQVLFTSLYLVLLLLFIFVGVFFFNLVSFTLLVQFHLNFFLRITELLESVSFSNSLA